MTCETFTATIYCGLRPGYEGEPHPIDKAIQIAQEYCDSVSLCVTVTPTTFVYKNGREPGVAVGLINYPRFETHPDIIRWRALALSRLLKDGLGQQRVSVVFPEDTVMIGAK